VGSAGSGGNVEDPGAAAIGRPGHPTASMPGAAAIRTGEAAGPPIKAGPAIGWDDTPGCTPGAAATRMGEAAGSPTEAGPVIGWDDTSGCTRRSAGCAESGGETGAAAVHGVAEVGTGACNAALECSCCCTQESKKQSTLIQ
jgi:hypothetical protein